MNNNPLQPTPGSLPQPIDNNEVSLSANQNQGAPAIAGAHEPATPLPPQATPQQPIAADADDLSPEWIQRVNSLVRQNMHDPKEFSQEFGRLKAQYIAGRYGKELKQPGEKG